MSVYSCSITDRVEGDGTAKWTSLDVLLLKSDGTMAVLAAGVLLYSAALAAE
jgi:hypothetical protein